MLTQINSQARTAYWEGFDAYCDGQPLEAMPTEAHRRGWWAACDAKVSTDEYEEQLADEDFWRQGC